MAPKKITVIERRLQGASALQQSSQPIPLKEPKVWTLRWANAEVRPDHLWQMINVLGWEYCSPEDITCPLDEIGANDRDGRIVKGERGKEVLIKIRTSDYKAIARKKAAENTDLTFNRKKLKNAMVSATADKHGSEAAEFIDKNTMTVTDSRERVAIDD